VRRGGAARLLAAGVPLVTAARTNGEWERAKTELLELLVPHYTHVRNLRRDGRPGPIAALHEVLEEIRTSADLLLFRRP